MTSDANDTAHPVARWPVTVDAYDFGMLAHNYQPWAGRQKRDTGRFEPLRHDAPVDYSWPHAYWFPDWVTIIIARSFLDGKFFPYQIITDLEDPLRKEAAHTLWFACEEHSCAECGVSPVNSYVILTPYRDSVLVPEINTAN